MATALRQRRIAVPAPFRTGDVLSISRQHFHRIAYTEWGDPDSERVVICVHGLTRQGRDFDPLATVLAGQGYRVVCPDLVGRGRSGRLYQVSLTRTCRGEDGAATPSDKRPGSPVLITGTW